jgi:hypothetical protein
VPFNIRAHETTPLPHRADFINRQFFSSYDSVTGIKFRSAERSTGDNTLHGNHYV